MREPADRTGSVTVTRVVPVPPERVWDCLADPCSFAHWVAGTARITSAHPDWPAVGSVLHHRWGLRPWRVRDRTTVVESDPPHRLVLIARARPLGVVKARLDVIGDGRRTRIVLREDILSGTAARVPRFTRLVQHLRNHRSLRRLARLVERTPDGTAASGSGVR